MTISWEPGSCGAFVHRNLDIRHPLVGTPSGSHVRMDSGSDRRSNSRSLVAAGLARGYRDRHFDLERDQKLTETTLLQFKRLETRQNGTGSIDASLFRTVEDTTLTVRPAVSGSRPRIAYEASTTKCRDAVVRLSLLPSPSWDRRSERPASSDEQ